MNVSFQARNSGKFGQDKVTKRRDQEETALRAELSVSPVSELAAQLEYFLMARV